MGEAENKNQNMLDQDVPDKELIELAKKRFILASEAEAENRLEELDDIRFMIGEQWTNDIKTSRLQDSRPCLTINRIPQFVRQVTNDQRQNRPGIKVNPAHELATDETAEVFQGIIRHIEYSSNADTAYDTSFGSAVKGGLGYFRLVTEYVDEMSFQQEIRIKQIKDRFSVYLDPNYQEPDGSDAEWGFVFEDMSEDEFRTQYPDALLSGMSSWESLGDMSNDWIKRDTVRVAEYYYKVYEKVEIVLLSDKSVMEKKDLDLLPDGLPDGVREVSRRKTLKPKIKWAKINGLEALEEGEILGKWIPIIPVIGEEELLEGKKIISGIIRPAKDPQRMYNFWKSCQAEMIALAPKAPFVGMAGTFEGFEDKWKTANTKNHAFLEYNAKSINGVMVQPPQRMAIEPPIQAITAASGEAGDDMKATTGVYDASLGNKSNEQSGVAIQRRSAQSQTSNFHFIDNLSRSMRHAGRIMLNWIPQVYDTAQTIRIIGEDGEASMVQINRIFEEGGEKKSHFLDHGFYDCTVSTGPSYQTKRQEAVASMLDLSRSLPQSMQVATDILVRNMDWPGAKEIADRIKKTLPPNITADDKDQPQIPPQVQQQLMQQGQMLQSLNKECAQLSEVIRTKSLEISSKERISLMEQQTQLRIEFMKHHAKDAQFVFDKEVEQIDRRLDMESFNQPIDSGAGGQMPTATPNQQQPTGGPPPGQSMGAQP